MSFDASVEQIFPVLCVGGTLVLRGELSWDLNQLNRVLQEESVTVMDLPTAYWQQWLEQLPQQPGDLRLVTVGGEALPADQLQRWRTSALGRIRFENTYGPTEATASVLSRKTAAVDVEGTYVPIGTSYSGRGAYVVAIDGEIAASGALGELCLGGHRLARGYLGQPGMTAERFIPDPANPGGRCYRSGDLCRREPDGTVKFARRVDRQLKLRGFRVEPAEIEAVLRTCAGVREVVVEIHHRADQGQLVAYVVGPADQEDLITHAARHLPAHQIPGAWIGISALPLTSNGKLNRAALPQPDLLVEGAPPETQTERVIAQIWARLLGVCGVGRHDDFFALGGHSLLAVRAVAQIAAQLNRPLELATLISHSTVATLAAALPAAAATHDTDQMTVWLEALE